MPSNWITHVKKYAAENNVSYKEALSKASASYKKGGAATHMMPDGTIMKGKTHGGKGCCMGKDTGKIYPEIGDNYIEPPYTAPELSKSQVSKKKLANVIEEQRSATRTPARRGRRASTRNSLSTS
jgi:hypothetical protein